MKERFCESPTAERLTCPLYLMDLSRSSFEVTHKCDGSYFRFQMSVKPHTEEEQRRLCLEI